MTAVTEPPARGRDRPAVYPVNRDPWFDERFTLSFVLDVVEVLVAHGFPRPQSPSDWIELNGALYEFIYAPR